MSVYERRRQGALERLDRVITRMEGGASLATALGKECLGKTGWNTWLRKSRRDEAPAWIWRRFEAIGAKPCDMACGQLALRSTRRKLVEDLQGIPTEFYFCSDGCFAAWVADDPHTVFMPDTGEE